MPSRALASISGARPSAAPFESPAADHTTVWRRALTAGDGSDVVPGDVAQRYGAAVYLRARVRAENRDSLLRTQYIACKDLAERLGYQVAAPPFIDMYPSHGVRDGLADLIRCVREGTADAVIVFAVDDLGRRLTSRHDITWAASRMGVPILAVQLARLRGGDGRHDPWRALREHLSL